MPLRLVFSGVSKYMSFLHYILTTQIKIIRYYLPSSKGKQYLIEIQKSEHQANSIPFPSCRHTHA